MATQEASRVEVPKPHRFSGKRDAKELDNFLWHMERYFEAITLTDEATKVRTATLYLIDTATLWWRRRFADMEKGICTIETWEDFRREIKRQFYREDVAYLARKNMRRLKHTGSIRDYVKEFSSLMLEIPNMTQEELLFNFMDNLQGWAEQELRRRGVQDLATAMAIAESLANYKRGDSSKIESLEDSHAMGGGDEVPRDHNAPKKGSSKTSNVREGRDKAERKEFTPKIKCFLCDGPHLLMTRDTRFYLDYPIRISPRGHVACFSYPDFPQGEAHDTREHYIRTTIISHPDDRRILSGYVCPDR
ncbi:hypothetical protein CK203_004525 [Vitis vinifera]|uniref:Ty3 transposon capsid-like protein domain-containing protein n=1 Tax=Vitis vinifera TaxID=29760 RepID=A0A438KGQ3_VITVI|nr:hypothetical protein CK203_004525 [Vitis vinifera]